MRSEVGEKDKKAQTGQIAVVKAKLQTGFANFG